MIIGELLALFTAICWAQNSVFYSITGKYVSSRTTAHIRLWIALPLILIINYFFNGEIFPLRESFKAYIYISLSGIIGYFLTDMMIFKAFVDIGPRETTVILTLSPIFSAILSYIIFKQKLNFSQITGIGLTIFGIIITVIGDSEEYKQIISYENNILKSFIKTFSKYKINNGVILAFIGSLGQAIGLIFAKIGQNTGTNPISTNTIRIASALIAFIILRLLNKELIRDFKKMENIRIMGLIAAAAIAGPILGVLAALYAINIAPVGIVSTIMQITPIILLPVEYFIFKNKLTVLSIIGTFIAVGGTVLLFLF